MHLNFKNWLLDETVKLLKDIPSNKLISLGKLGWWHVYYALPDNKNNLTHTKPLEYNKYMQLVQDRKADVEPSLVYNIPNIYKAFREAAYRLAKLGFPQMNQVALIKALDKYNPITGGGSAGFFANKEHGMVISSSYVAPETIIHEHAHAYWFNLPKHNKEFFKDYYTNVVKNIKLPTNDLWQAMPSEKNIKLTNQNFQYGWEEFIKQLDLPENMSLENYIDLLNAHQSGNNQKIIAMLATPQNSNRANAKLKKDLPVETFSKKYLTLKAGTIVEVERYNYAFIINYYKDNNNYERYEYPKSLKFNDLLTLVEFDYEILSDHQKDRFNQSSEIFKSNPLQLLVGKDKDKIHNAFLKSAEAIASKFSITKHRAVDSKYKSDQLLNKHFNYYNSWMAVMSRRLKNGKINKIEDVRDAYLYVIKKAEIKDFHNEPPHSLGDSDLPDISRIDLSKPEADIFRKLIAKSGATVSAYGAANVDELWATTVEYAATDQNVPQVLRKLIYKTISGI